MPSQSLWVSRKDKKRKKKRKGKLRSFAEVHIKVSYKYKAYAVRLPLAPFVGQSGFLTFGLK